MAGKEGGTESVHERNEEKWREFWKGKKGANGKEGEERREVIHRSDWRKMRGGVG